MSRRTDEQEVIKRFLPFLSQVTGQEWEPSRDEVPTGKNNRSYDCEFTSLGATPIAEMFADCSLAEATNIKTLHDRR